MAYPLPSTEDFFAQLAPTQSEASPLTLQHPTFSRLQSMHEPKITSLQARRRLAKESFFAKRRPQELLSGAQQLERVLQILRK